MCPITSASHTSVMLKEKKEKQKKHCRLNLKTHRRHFPYDSCRRCLRIAVVYSATCSVSVFTSVSCICRASPVGRWSSSSLAHVFFVRKFPATESDTLFFVKSRKYVPGGLADEGRSLGGGFTYQGQRILSATAEPHTVPTRGTTRDVFAIPAYCSPP